ncbi:hypothetical protein LP417_06800 [Polaromonas sp. P1-6]|nr:hypothetical protein LP417_06800 [Polaromonas sp. P1-6]
MKKRANAMLWIVLASSLPAGAAWSQAATDPGQQAQCRADVSKFEQAIGYIRQTQGNQAASDLKEKLLPAKLETEILFKDGYCGLARHLHDKKLHR